jgi:hypothetical protein
MLHRQSVQFIGKYDRLSKIAAGFFAPQRALRSPIKLQMGYFGAVFNSAWVSNHDAP